MRTSVDRTQLPSDVLAVCSRLRERGHRAWVVGGCVRDHLLERPVSDWDVCTTALPAEVKRAFSHVISTGEKHGTVTVLLNKVGYEVTTLRGEKGYSDGRRPDEVYFVDDVREDLARRDFTVNAIAYDPLGDSLEDPFDGIGDLERKILRAVRDPRERFAEDGLRVLRAARFVATLEFTLDPATKAAISENLETFRRVSAERVRDEWMKTMKAREPSRAFEVMRETGILSVVCPELLELVGVASSTDGEDVWEHSVRALDVSPRGDALFRLVALLHDVAYPKSAAKHAEDGARFFENFCKSWRFSNEERVRGVHLVRHHDVALSEAVAWTDAQVRQFVRRVGRESLEEVLALLECNVRGHRALDESALSTLKTLGVRAREQAKAPLTARELLLDGKDLQVELGLPPSRKLGEILQVLLDRVVEDPSFNERPKLLALAAQLARES